MRLAIMQPYFIPYAGYFRLFAATDLFVVYDCVQFPRRGWVHRNRLRDVHGNLDWLTLPLKKAPQDVRIDALAFDHAREKEWQENGRKFPALSSPPLQDLPFGVLSGMPIDYVERLLGHVCGMLNIPFNITRSSALNLPSELKGQDRILAICEHFGTKTYVNSPGGRELYDAAAFQRKGIELTFLSAYDCSFDSIAERLATTPIHDIRREIMERLTLEAA